MKSPQSKDICHDCSACNEYQVNKVARTCPKHQGKEEDIFDENYWYERDAQEREVFFEVQHQLDLDKMAE